MTTTVARPMDTYTDADGNRYIAGLPVHENVWERYHQMVELVEGYLHTMLDVEGMAREALKGDRGHQLAIDILKRLNDDA